MRTAEGIIAASGRSRLIQEWLDRQDAAQTPEDAALKSPADVLAQRLAYTAIMLRDPNIGPDDTALAERMAAAPPYLWMSYAYDVAKQMTVPPHVLGRETLPEPDLWFTFSGFGLEITFEDGTSFRVSSIFLADRGDGFTVTFLGTPVRLEEMEAGVEWRLDWRHMRVSYGSPFPRDCPEVGPVLAMLAFLSSPYIPKARQRVDRAARRRAEAAGEVGASEAVTFVDLRSAIRRIGPEEGEERDVRWHHRWVVRGHLRAQWYPSRETHQVIYVPSYVKGPEALPLKQPVYRVKR